MDIPPWLSTDALKSNPAERLGVDRFTSAQAKAFIQLITTPQCYRSPHQLWDSGVIRPDLSKETFTQLWVTEVVELDKVYYLSSDFLHKWFDVGYISYEDLPSEKLFSAAEATCTYYKAEKHLEDTDSRELLNMSYAVITDADCHLNFCYLAQAKFDNTNFYKANIVDCVLVGATAYNSHFIDCNGYHAEYSILAARYLKKCGLLGIDLNYYAI